MKTLWNKQIKEFFKEDLKLFVDYFDARDQYRKDLLTTLKTHTIDQLSVEMQRTIPSNLLLLYAPPWRWSPFVVFKVYKTAYKCACNKYARELAGVKEEEVNAK